MKLFEILIPAERKLEHHLDWDAKVTSITGGLSIMPIIRGHWQSDLECIVREKMVPVRLIASDEQMLQIAQLTGEHYQQKSIMYYVISQEAFVVSVA